MEIQSLAKDRLNVGREKNLKSPIQMVRPNGCLEKLNKRSLYNLMET